MGGVGFDQLLDNVTLMNTLRDELFAFLALNYIEIMEDGIRKISKNADFEVIKRLERLTSSHKRPLNGRCPHGLRRQDDNLTRILRHIFVEGRTVENLSFEDGSIRFDSFGQEVG